MRRIRDAQSRGLRVGREWRRFVACRARRGLAQAGPAMSVIGNALKAAQREKQRRTGGGAPPALIVPLKTRASSGAFRWQRALVLVVGGAAIFGATAYGVKLMKGNARPAPVPAPTILGDVPVTRSDSAKPPSDGAQRVAI